MTRCEKCDAPAVVLSARLTLMPAELCAACNALGDQYRVEIEASERKRIADWLRTSPVVPGEQRGYLSALADAILAGEVPR